MLSGSAQRLRTFVLVTDLGSISRAAAVLGYTQSAVSQQLVALERDLGMTLVDRAQRPLRPTPAGTTLRPHVERALGALAAADAVVEDLRGRTRRLRVAAFPSALSSFVPLAVRDFRRGHRDVVVQTLQLETREATEQVRSGAADVAIVHHIPGVAAPDAAGLARRHLLVDPLHLVLPERHRLARREEVRVADLHDEAWILPRRDTPAGRFRSAIEQLCAEAGFAPRIAYELDDLPAAQAFAAMGLAIVPMHGLTLTTVPPGATVRPFAEPPSRTVEALLPGGAPSAAAGELVDRLRDAAGAYRRLP